MKRRLFTLIVLATMFAGVAWTQVQFGIRAGVNFQNINGEYNDGEKLKNNLRLGFHGGVEVDIPLVPGFYIQPGILFNLKGASSFLEDQFLVDDVKASISYIEVPVHFLYKPELGTGRVFIGFGPYFAYGITGKLSNDDEEVDIKFTNDADSDLEEFPLKPLDIGADIFFGYEFDFGLFAQINAQLGLLNLVPKFDGETPDGVLKNTGFGVSLGFKF